MNIRDFYAELEDHNWYYRFLGDYKLGLANHIRLHKLSRISPTHTTLYNDFIDYIDLLLEGDYNAEKPQLEDYL